MKQVTVNASSRYDILIGKGLLSKVGTLCAKTLGLCRLCVVTDDTVDALYFDTVSRSLTEAGFDVLKFVIPHGEASKSTASLVELLEFLASHHMTRSDCVITLGGGVVGDLGGFAAAVYLRGIRFVQIPTTLLAAVDSSVGGKTAVDLAAGKNLAGAFHQPSLVICDPDTLDTLPQKIFAEGCAEVIKYGVIQDRALFDRLRAGIREQAEEVIAACVEHKKNLVEQDEFDRGARQLLNLGHTVGHAIELCSAMEISHGDAVAMGMVIVTRASVQMGLCPRKDLDSLLSLLSAEHLPTVCPFSAHELTEAALNDKKRSGEHLTLVLPYAIGDSRLYKIPITELCALIEKGL